MQKVAQLFILLLLVSFSSITSIQADNPSKVSISGPEYVEVGVPATFTLSFTPRSPLPAGTAYYKITEWYMFSPDSPSNSSIVGFTGTF